MGRPSVYSTEEIIAALKQTKGMVYLAAELVGCDADTIYYRAKHEQPIANAIKSQRGKVVDTSEQKLFTAMEANEPWAIQMILKMLGKDRGYVEKMELDSTTKSTLEVTEVIVSTRAEAEAILRMNPEPK